MLTEIIIKEKSKNIKSNSEAFNVIRCTDVPTGTKVLVSHEVWCLEQVSFDNWDSFLQYSSTCKEQIMKINLAVDRMISKASNDTLSGDYYVSFEEFIEEFLKRDSDFNLQFVCKYSSEIIQIIRKNPYISEAEIDDGGFCLDFDCEYVCQRCDCYNERGINDYCHQCDIWCEGMEDAMEESCKEVQLAKQIGESQFKNPYLSGNISFKFNGQTIVNPFKDSTGRFELSLKDAYTLYGIEDVNGFICECVKRQTEKEPHILSIVQKYPGNDVSYWQVELSDEDEQAIYEIFRKYETSGCSVRGTKDDVLKEIAEDFNVNYSSSSIFDGCKGTKDMIDSAITAIFSNLQYNLDISNGDVSVEDALYLDKLETNLYKHIDHILELQKVDDSLLEAATTVAKELINFSKETDHFEFLDNMSEDSIDEEVEKQIIDVREDLLNHNIDSYLSYLNQFRDLESVADDYTSYEDKRATELYISIISLSNK